MDKPSIEQTQFAEIALRIINPTVEEFGFALHKVEIEKYFTNIIWRKKDLFIRIQSTNYPTDYPYYYTIKFGEHYTEDFKIQNLGSVPLWRFIKRLTSKTEEYTFPYGDEVIPSIEKANNDLRNYGISFLTGDLELYFQLRNEQNEIGNY